MSPEYTYSSFALPRNLIKARNRALYLSFLEVVVSLVGLVLSRVLLASSLIVLVAAAVSLAVNLLGLLWRLRLDFAGLTIHLVL